MFEMERDGVAPTGEVFATLAGIAARDGDVAGVEKVLERSGAGVCAPARCLQRRHRRGGEARRRGRRG